jgi:tripartite-type tricarboxylate transporter receptor subunit TctC
MQGEVQCLFVTLSSAVAQAKEGRLRALAVTTGQRVAELPAVPTLAESGYRDFIASSWQGLLAPAGTPAELVQRWHALVQQVLRKEDVARRFRASATEPVGSGNPKEFADFIAREGERWGALVRRSGAAAE